MRVLRGNPSIKVPVWNPYFVAGIPEFLYKIVKESKGRFTSAYHRSLRLLEVDKPTLDFMVDQCKKHNINVSYIGEDRPEPPLRLFEDDPDYKYQEDAAEMLAMMPNALLQFGVGSGKTRITLLALEKRYALNPNLRVLVVTGLAALQQNWLDDSNKFGLCKGKITITGIGNSKESLSMIKSAGDGQILTANFDMLSNLDLLYAFSDFNADIVIFDEVHVIVNMGNKRKSGAMRTEGVHELQGDHWSLSATPVMYTPFDWRSLLIWLRVFNPEMSQSGFESYYGEFGINYMGQRVCTEYKNLECLLPLINSVRLCFGGVELPDIDFVDVPVGGGDKKSPYNVQVYNNCVNTEKLAFLRTLDSAIIASNITKPFNVIKESLEAWGNRVEVFDGTLSLKSRNELISRCYDGKVDKLLLSISAGGTGLNLTCFNKMVFIEAPHSLVVYWQCYGRVYRIGQKNKVTIYRLYCKGTKDETKWKQICTDFEALKIFYEF